MERHRGTAEQLKLAIKEKHGSNIPYVFTLSEVAKHAQLGDCYVIVHHKVYDVTPYVQRHPGGSGLILDRAGGDVTADFEAGFHSKIARMLLDQMYIGDVAKAAGQSRQGKVTGSRGGGGSSLNPLAAAALTRNLPARPKPSPRPSAAIDLIKWTEMAVSDVQPVTHDSVLVTVALPAPHTRLPLELGHHIFVGVAQAKASRSATARAAVTIAVPGDNVDTREMSTATPVFAVPPPPAKSSLAGPKTPVFATPLPKSSPAKSVSFGAEVTSDARDMVSRPYTPIANGNGKFSLLIKKYPGGAVSPALCSLRPGDKILVRGPAGNYRHQSDPGAEFGMVAGGTGITVLLPIIHALLGVDSTAAPELESGLQAGAESSAHAPVSESSFGTGTGRIEVDAAVRPQVAIALENAGDAIPVGISASADSLRDAGSTGLSAEGPSITLVYCNKTKEDALLSKHLRELEQRSRGRFSVCHVLSAEDTPPNGSWLQGRITGDHLRSSGFPPPSAEKLSLLVCGPVAMHEHLVGVLKSTGYDESACKFFE